MELQMRTNIVIDDELIERAMKLAGLPTKKAAVEAGLRLLVQVKGQAEVRRWRGKVKWEGDLDKSRSGRVAR
jgi:Arc/MetJ family transcription regulator